MVYSPLMVHFVFHFTPTAIAIGLLIVQLKVAANQWMLVSGGGVMEWIFPVHTAGHAGVRHLSSVTTFLPGAGNPADAPKYDSTEEWTHGVCVLGGGLGKGLGFSHLFGIPFPWQRLENTNTWNETLMGYQPKSPSVTPHIITWTSLCKTPFIVDDIIG